VTAGALLALALVAAGAPGSALGLVGIREETRPVPDASPPRMEVTFDFLTPGGAACSKRVMLLDGPMVRGFFAEPFVYPESRDSAFLLAGDREGYRVLRISWKTGESSGNSFLVRRDAALGPESRPVRVLQDRFLTFDDRVARVFDLRLEAARKLPLARRAVDVDATRKRLYVERPEGDATTLLYHEMDPCDPDPVIGDDPKPLLSIAERGRLERATVSPDGLRAACVFPLESERPDAWRFLFVVADVRERVLVRRSFPGRAHDLRFVDGDRVLLAVTTGETTVLHVVDVPANAVRTTVLRETYIAPPEIVPAELLPIPER